MDRVLEAGIIDRYEVGGPYCPVLGAHVGAGMTGISIPAGLNVIAAIQETEIVVMVEPVAAVIDYSEFEAV